MRMDFFAVRLYFYLICELGEIGGDWGRGVGVEGGGYGVGVIVGRVGKLLVYGVARV